MQVESTGLQGRQPQPVSRVLSGGGVRVRADSIDSGQFFVTADAPPNNIYLMCIPPRPDKQHGLCQNIHDESYWTIVGNRLVRLIREDEYDQTMFAPTE